MAKKRSAWSTESTLPDVADGQEQQALSESSVPKTYRMKRGAQVNQLTFLEGHDYELSPDLAETLRSFGAV